MDLRSKAGMYLLRILSDLGYCSNSGFGLHPIKSEELLAYNQIHNEENSNLELQMILRMSKAFVDGYNKGANPLKVTPHERYDEIYS